MAYGIGSSSTRSTPPSRAAFALAYFDITAVSAL